MIEDEELDFTDWFCDYCDLLREEGYPVGFEDKAIARRHFNRGKTPEAAAHEDARFMATGEY